MVKRIIGAVLLWLLAIVMVVVLSRGPAWSVELYQVVAVEPLIGWGAWISTAALLALVVTYASAGLWFVLEKRPTQDQRWQRLFRLVFGGGVACLSYGINLALKDGFAAVRPCHLHDIVSACPPAENWSFPSNHTVIAFSLMSGLIVAWPRLSWLVVPLAVLAACARVLSGDHYPHDVLAGAALATLFYLGIMIIAAPALDRGAQKLHQVRETRKYFQGAAEQATRQ